MIRFALLCLLTSLSAPAWATPVIIEDSLAQRLAACTTCHGKEGRAAPDGYFPRIAGKPAGYLFNQLQNFREGRRSYGPMVALMAPLPDSYLREMAEYFAALDLPYPAPAPTVQDATVLERGRQLAQQGDARKGLPACASCHGTALTGVRPAVPGLLGLPRDYLAGQLGAWLHGERHARAPDCMADVAKKLDGGDLVAVSAWLAGQPVPPASKPATALAKVPSLRCGSMGATP